jgi:hypothetical protein
VAAGQCADGAGGEVGTLFGELGDLATERLVE